MSRRLGKKHWQYIGNEGLELQKREPTVLNPKRMVADLYRVKLLNYHTFLRDVYWNPQQDLREGLAKRLKPSKQKFYDKLERYWHRTGNGR